MKLLTEAELIKRRWWWRHTSNFLVFNAKKHTTKEQWPIWPQLPKISRKQPPIWPPIWKDGAEWAAYSYELLRRAGQQPAKLPPFLNLSVKETDFLKRLFGKSNMLWTSSTAPRPGYSDAIHWNLSLSDGALRKAFLEWIAEQRQKHNVKTARGRVGQTSKSPSWLWPEMIDLNTNGLRNHPDFDSGILSRATRLAVTLANRFFAQLALEKDRASLWPKIVSCNKSSTL
jgi:hypothetical protein